MSTYTAEIGVSRAVALTDMCAVTVVDDADVRKGMESVDTALPVDGDHARQDVIDAAEAVLTARGWQVAGDWMDGDDSYYVAVQPA